MPSSIPINESPRSLIPPTPESDFSTSPQSPTFSDPNNSGEIPPPPQRRKAGRKPLYKTAQERRDRNRRAQLAFRARRSDYLSRLEETCRSLETVVLELQESNRAANDALARERSQVKYLERILQNQPRLNQQNTQMFPSNSAITIPAENNQTAPAGQAVSSQLFPQVHSLITLEQQFSSQTPSASINNMVFTENFSLGMFPLPIFVLRVLVCSCRCVTGLSPPTNQYQPFTVRCF
jgi:hypothetical protein